MQSRIDFSPGDTFTLGGSARLDAGYRVHEIVAVGVHLGLDYMQEVDEIGTVTHVPFEVGIGAQFVIGDRFLIAPWLGELDLVDHRNLAGGADLAYDLWQHDRNRLSALAMVTVANASTHWKSFGVGLAYRYW